MMHMMGMGIFGGMFGFGWILLLALAGYLGYRLLRRSPRGRIGEGGRNDGAREVNSSLEHRIYRFAAQHGGAVTVSELVVETGIEAQRIEQHLDGMVDERRVRMEVEDDGTTVYYFPELRRGNSSSAD
jgi:hypothetical protein